MASRTGEVVASGHAATLTPIVLTASHDPQSESIAMAGDSRALLRSLEVPRVRPANRALGRSRACAIVSANSAASDV